MPTNKASLTKKELVRKLSSGLGLRAPAATAAVEAVLEAISGALAEGRRCEFRDFGSFFVQRRKASLGRNPRSPGQVFAVDEHNVVRFRPSAALRIACNQPPRRAAARAKSGENT